MIKRLGGVLVGAFLLTLVCSLSLLAQESTVKGNLGGTVIDSSGAVVPNVKVTASGPIGTRTVISDAEGRFMFDLLTPGFYSVKAEQTGFKTVQVRDIEIFANRTSRAQLTLQPGGATETIEVSADTVEVDETTTKLETNLNDTFYSQVPVGRNVTGLFYAAAGVNEGGGTGSANPSIAGGSGLENQYIADGVNITDGAFGGIGVFSRNYGPLATGINLSFVKEVDVKTGGYEPQYGKSTGGIIQIVTKSGSNQYHGGISAFFGPQQFEARHLNPDDSGRLNQQGAAIHQGEWDVAAELGGYVPHFQDKLFFFGSFNPSWNRLYDRFAPLHFVSGFNAPGQTTIPQISYDYAAKLTYKLNEKHVLETSVFGDPTRETSAGPNGPGFALLSLAVLNTSSYSKISNGTRNWVARYNGTLSPTWLFNASFSWGHNYLNETPSAPNVFQVTDNTGAGDGTSANGPLGTPLTGIFNRQGLGYYENTAGENYRLSFDTQKVVNLWGQHTFNIGYNYERGRYDGTRQATGGGYTVPNVVADSSGLPRGITDFANSFELDPAANWGWSPQGPGLPTCQICVFANVPGQGPTEVVLLQNRGFFSTPAFDAHAYFHAAYVGDSWAIGRHITVNAGYRWEQQTLQGLSYTDPLTGIHKQAHYTFTDNWSPRFGLAIDPLGDRKTKIYANFARTNYALPLDAGIRSLGNEEDAFFLDLIPPFTNPNPGTPCSPTNPCQLAVNSDGSITPAIDDAHAIGIPAFGFPNTPKYFALSTQPGEAIAKGTKMMYQDGFVAGVEHEFRHGLVLSVRYQQNKLRRIVEDMSGVSPEANLTAGITQQFAIGNPSASLDVFTNPNEQIFPVGGLPSNCPINPNTGNVAGGTNTNFYTGAQADVCVFNPAVAGNAVPDGKPDGAATPVRLYKATEVEFTKSFSKGWQMRSNYRWSTLAGNYEGAFRNDNGQSDPGITSLFDFTPGQLNELGDQFAVGFLNTDRRHIFNNFISYTFSSSFLKNLTVGTGVRIETGTPLSDLRAHPVYGNGGEVPIGGRGVLGRLPTHGSGDIHADYEWKLTEKQRLHFGADLFNVANQKTLIREDQFQDASLGVANFDFKRPQGSGNVGVVPAYQRPFYGRLMVKWEF